MAADIDSSLFDKAPLRPFWSINVNYHVNPTSANPSTSRQHYVNKLVDVVLHTFRVFDNSWQPCKSIFYRPKTAYFQPS